MVYPVGHRGLFTGKRRQIAFHKIPKRLPRGVDIGSVAVNEVHRHVEQVIDVAFETEAVLENERQHAAAVGVGVGPDVAAVGQEPGWLSFLERRVRPERRGDRLQCQRDPEHLHHGGFGIEIQVDLHRASGLHHF